jgi:hypothetical protein
LELPLSILKHSLLWLIYIKNQMMEEIDPWNLSCDSITRIRFKAIMWCFELDLIFWQFSQVLQNACVSLNKVGQYNPHCKIVAAVFFDVE